MPLTTAERATVQAALDAIPVSDVDLASLQQQLADAQATIASQAATIATQASEIEALNYGVGQLEARIAAGRAGIAATVSAANTADAALT